MRKAGDLPEPDANGIAACQDIGPELSLELEQLICIHAEDVRVKRRAAMTFDEIMFLPAPNARVCDCRGRNAGALGRGDEPSRYLAQAELSTEEANDVGTGRQR